MEDDKEAVDMEATRNEPRATSHDCGLHHLPHGIFASFLSEEIVPEASKPGVDQRQKVR